MGVPNPRVKTKGARTTLWLYTGSGDAFSNPLTDDDWLRLAGIKDLQPGEMSADVEEDDYLDDDDADWKNTAAGQKSAGDTTATLAWKPGETGQKKLVELFISGDIFAFRIKYPNGTVDVFRGWVSSLGKAIASKEVMTRSVKISGTGRPFLAEEDTPAVVSVSGVTVAPASASVAVGSTITLTFTVRPGNATEKSLRIGTSDPLTATVNQAENVVKVKGIKAGKVNIAGISTDGGLAAIAAVTVTAA